MSTCLRHVEVIIHDQFFFMNFAFVCNEEGASKGTTYSVIETPVHGELDGNSFNSIPQSVGKYNRFCKHL